MARLFESFVHEDEKVAAAVQDLLQTELDLRVHGATPRDEADIKTSALKTGPSFGYRIV
jgi:hypothetical protein